MRSLGALFAAILVALVILYGAMLVISRTAGFRALVQDAVQRYTNWPVQVERAYLTPTLRLTLVGLRGSGNLTSGKPGFNIARLSTTPLQWLWGSFTRSGRPTISLTEPFVSVGYDGSGEAQPASLRKLVSQVAALFGAPIPTTPDDHKNTEPNLPSMREIRRGRFEWHTPDGLLLSIEGLDLQHDFFVTSSRPLHYWHVRARRVNVPDLPRLEDVELEMLEVAPEQLVVLSASATLDTGQHRESNTRRVTEKQTTNRWLQPMPLSEIREVLLTAANETHR